MSDSAQKAIEMQCNVKRNADDFRTQLNDLYNWEKEIKDKERDLKRAPSKMTLTKSDETEQKLPPVRSQVLDNKDSEDAKELKVQQAAVAAATNADKAQSNEKIVLSPTEKFDLPLDEIMQRHKEANDIKDHGNNYVKLSQYDQAIDAYTDAIRIYPDDPIYFINRALCYLKQERYDLCIEDCEMALDLDKLCVKAYYRRMQANESMGNNMDALKDCTTVLAIEPKNMEAKSSLLRINERLRKTAPVEVGPNFTSERPDLIDILPIEKPVYKRSNCPLVRVSIADVVTPKVVRDDPNTSLRISDEDIDKLFSINCGSIEEVKKDDVGNKKKRRTPTEKAAQMKINDNSTRVPLKSSQAEQPNKQITQKREEGETEKQKQAQPKEEHLNESAQKPAQLASPLPPAPSSSAQFYTQWKELEPQQKYGYLKSIEVAQLCKILGAGFDSDTLIGLLNILNDFYLPNNESTLAAETLLEISKNTQVSILSMLMSKEERNVLDKVLKTLDADLAATKTILKNFALRI